jgi:hypothetical protein
MQAMKICGLCGTANEPGNIVCISCGKNGFLVQRGKSPPQASGISRHLRDLFSALMLVVVGVYLVVYLRGRPSTNMTAQLMGGAIILMGIVLTIYAIYKYIKRTRS